MAKKSNKTEQVLKLLTKEDEMAETAENEEMAPDRKEKQEELKASDVEISVKAKEPQELSYEAKLKIEINPEVAIKGEVEEPQATAAPTVSAAPAAPATPIEPVAPPEPATPSNKAESNLFRESKHLVNLAELFVAENLHTVMERLNVCTCPICTSDVMAMALNSLPTQYVTTDTGKQYLQLQAYKKQYETDVISALTKACVRVKASPRHGE